MRSQDLCVIDNRPNNYNAVGLLQESIESVCLIQASLKFDFLSKLIKNYLQIRVFKRGIGLSSSCGC